MKNETSEPVISLESPPILQKSLRNKFYGSNTKIKLYDEKIIYYKDTTGLNKEKKQETQFTAGNNTDTYKGFLSEATRRKLKKKVGIWIDAIKTFNRKTCNRYKKDITRPVFITLTLPTKQLHGDKEIKRQALIPFIQKLNYHYGVVNYFWRAESQENGNIHFHIIVDRYMSRFLIWKLWTESINTLGYMDRYYEIHPGKNDFTVKIKGYGNYEALKSYVLKYALKNDDVRPINGAVWGASKPLKLLKPLSLSGRNFLFQILALLRGYHKIKVLRGEHFGIIFIDDISEKHKEDIKNEIGYTDYMLFLYAVMYNSRHPDDLFEVGLFSMNAFDIEPEIEDILAI